LQIPVTRLAPALVLVIAVSVVMAGCSVHRGAPVFERSSGSKSTTAAPRAPGAAPPRAGDSRPEFYTVRKGDTLFSIALDNGLDYRELAEWNGITDPGVIRVGQALRLRPPKSSATIAPLKTAPAVEGRPIAGAQPSEPGAPGRMKTEPKAVRVPYTEQAYAQLAHAKVVTAPVSRPAPVQPPQRQAPEGENGPIAWTWPASGKVISTFNDAARFKGISIAGKLGQPVTASAAGKVIFSGTGIRGLGKLIIIKHNDAFLTVYAHNSELLVKQDQTVAKGQKIAEMGKTDTDQVKLHFEIRRFGKPVDPMKLLPQS
jgi:lipoprotein NlpD